MAALAGKPYRLTGVVVSVFIGVENVVGFTPRPHRVLSQQGGQWCCELGVVADKPAQISC